MKTSDDQFIWAMSVCCSAQMRVTPVRQAILEFLATSRVPVTLETVSNAPGVSGHCDSTTVYRTLMLFREADIVRLVGSSRRERFFCLNVPGENNHFLICRECGQTSVLRLPERTVSEVAAAAAASGFSPTKQDYEVHGLCNECQSARKEAHIPSKLPVANRAES
jgi:Fur family transcriptional regulator, zinc uptake regulator